MRRLLNINRVRPKKSLGQNFITNNNFLLKMNDHIDSSKSNIIIEIGPGKGALTEYLSKKNFKELFLIEKDNNLAAQLKLKYKKIKNIFIINDDALTFNYSVFKNPRPFNFQGAKYFQGTGVSGNYENVTGTKIFGPDLYIADGKLGKLNKPSSVQELLTGKWIRK